MKKWKKFWVRPLAAALCVIYFLTIKPDTAEAEQYWPEGPQVESPSAIVMEVNTGTVLYEKNSHDQHYPASITKIMTALLALENCDMDEIVTFSADAVFKNEGDTSNIARDLGEELTMEQCLYAIMLASANECAYAVAEHVGAKLGGDYNTFIDLMNQKAQELGCTDTHFHNPNGLPDSEHWTSAYDMALIASAAYHNEDFRIIAGSGTYIIPPTNKKSEQFICHNRHKMLYPYQTSQYLYEYCTGGKTGYTDVANSTLVTFAEKDGLTLVCIIMNAIAPSHWTDTRSLLDYCFDNFQKFRIAENESSIADDEQKNTGLLNNSELFVTLDADAYIVLPKTAAFKDAAFELDTEQSNGSIAALKYTYADRDVGSVEIVETGAKAELPPFQEKSAVQNPGVKVVKIRPVMILGVLLVILLLLGLIFLVSKLYDNYYVIRHNMLVRKDRRERFRIIKKKKRRKNKRKDRFFQ